MKIPQIKLQWGGAKTTPGEWRLGLWGRYERKSGRGRGLAISLRGVASWSLLAGALSYAGAAGYVWWKLEQRPYNFVSYTDLLLYPVRKTQINEARGQAMIAEGFDDFEAKKWQSALMKLRVGLEKYPRDLNARLKVAQFFLGSKLRMRAQETLLGGLEFGWPGRAYLENAINVVQAGEDFDLVIALCDRGLSLHDPARHAGADRRWLVEQRVRALLAAERPEDVLVFLEQQKETLGDAVYSELRLLVLLQLGRTAEGVEFAEAWRKRAGDTAQVLRMLARTYRDAGRAEAMRGALEELRRQSPADPRVRVYSIIQTLLLNLDEEADAQIEDYLFRFGGVAKNFVLLAEPLGEIKRRPQLDRLLAAAAERGIKDPKLQAARLQILFAEKNWPEALRQLQALHTGTAGLGESQASMLEFLRALVTAAADPAEGSQSSLIDYVRSLQLPMTAYRQSIELLRAAGRPATAREIITFAEGVFPANRYLAATRTAIDAELAETRARAEAAKPVAVIPAILTNEKAFFRVLDTTATERGPEAALLLIGELRRARPAWLLETQERVARNELGYLAKGNDQVAFTSAARSYINNDRVRLRYAVELAGELHAAAKPEAARMILEEILRQLPKEPSALALMARWFPVVPDGSAAK
ncbi:MAG: hypothetical protein NTU80_10105 [Verrucomicrobia bacterium]|nr:hypothetical protein [Verrucomicrobiota bacterium]